MKLIFSFLISYPLAGLLKRVPDARPQYKNLFIIRYDENKHNPNANVLVDVALPRFYIVRLIIKFWFIVSVYSTW